MSKNRKNLQSLPAFSIIEAVVGMAITAIIMGILFVIFSIITGRMLDFKNQNQLINDLNRLTYSLNKDIFEKEKMMVVENEIYLNGYTGERVSYQFSEDYILRNSETFIDTFRVKFNRILLDTVRSKSEQFVFQKVKLNIEANEKEMDLSFYKRVYPNELLQTIKK
ncbi:type II secretion system protein J [Flavobacterium sp. FlaQc-50]|jgi:type II secretory pathway pseudopilin PulG|uniref:PulJ/GspJ family protein n=1 Tax=unclassified Flavobacterium TaxID=196869 RepID=UPI00375795B3